VRTIGGKIGEKVGCWNETEAAATPGQQNADLAVEGRDLERLAGT
jgi:hypothetical protein